MISSTLTDRIAVVTIERADKANSLSRAAKAALAAEVRAWAANSEADAIVLTGQGDRAFCAGSDIDEMRHFGMAEMDAMLADERSLYLSALTCPKPVVAAVNGYALGAGLILAMSCDYIVAAPHAAFGTPELTIGVAAPLEGFLLPYFVGLARARAMFYTGARVEAEQAVGIGLVNEVASPASLKPRALAIARQLADLPGDAFSVQKQLLHRLLMTGDLDAVIRDSHHLTIRQFAKPEVGQAMTRFISERPTKRAKSDPPVSGAASLTTASSTTDRLAPEEREWMTREAEQVNLRSEMLAGEAAWRPQDERR